MLLTTSNELYYWGINQGIQKLDLSISKLYGDYMITTEGDLYEWKENLLKIELFDVQKVVYSDHHAIALTNQNELYAWGANKYGQLGIGGWNDSHEPQKVKNLSNIRKVYTTKRSSFAITHNNELYSWGSSDHRKLGHGKYNDILPTPYKVWLKNIKDFLYVSDNIVILVTWLGEVYYSGHSYPLDSNYLRKLYFAKI